MDIIEGLNGTNALYLLMGTTMFAGKSSEAWRQVTRLRKAGERVLMLAPRTSARDGDQPRRGLASSHGGVEMQVEYVETLSEACDLVKDVKWIVVDEAQMFGEALVHFVKLYFGKQGGKSLIVCGLVADYQGRKWGNIADLLPLGPTDVHWCRAICSVCNRRSATHTRLRQTGGKDDEETQVLVGGADLYYVTCPDCDK